MKRITLTTLALFSIFLGFSQQAEEPIAAEGVSLTIVLENVLSDQGDILAGLHNAATFMRGAGLDTFKTTAQKGSMRFTFENVPPGTYAVSVMQDLNANGRMDFEASGMPKEPYGMSNNEMTMGPPTFASAAFEVGTEAMELHIRF